jgi:hypothetical protein
MDLRQAKEAALLLDGLVLEGDFPRETEAPPGSILLSARDRMPLNSSTAIVGTWQGVWPGVRPAEDGAHAAASGAPWIDTNTGFLRYARAATAASVWIAVRPPAGQELAVGRYLHAIGDAAMTGSRWVLDLEPAFWERLFARQDTALKDWARILETLRFYESHPEWRTMQSGGQLALVEDAASGALLSGGVLDMIAVKHTPVRPVPPFRMSQGAFAPVRMAVNVDPESLTGEQKELLKRFTAAGGTLLNGPPGWKFPDLKPGQITLEKADLDRIEQIWKEMNSMIGRRNLGARLFNVASMLSNLIESGDGKRAVLHLVNYSDYDVENITVHLLGQFRSARLLRPGKPPLELERYAVEDGTGIDIASMGVVAAVELER